MTMHKRIAIFVALLICLVILLVFAQFFVATPPIREDKGQSVALLEKIGLVGMEQWVLIRGENRTNPVLL